MAPRLNLGVIPRTSRMLIDRLIKGKADTSDPVDWWKVPNEKE